MSAGSCRSRCRCPAAAQDSNRRRRSAAIAEPKRKVGPPFRLQSQPSAVSPAPGILPRIIPLYLWVASAPLGERRILRRSMIFVDSAGPIVKTKVILYLRDDIGGDAA